MKLFRFGQSQTPAASHTSGFADAADQGTPSFGSMSPETFEQRKHTDRNRQHIAKFHQAGIHRDYRALHHQSRTVQPEHGPRTRPQTPLSRPAQPTQAIVRPTGGYREPQSRGFHPFR